MEETVAFYTGHLIYKDINFSFVFDGEELRLIPPKDKMQEIQYTWILKPIAEGVYVNGDSLVIEQSILKGVCNENGHSIVFLCQKGRSISSRNDVLIFPVVGYIKCKTDSDSIDRITFQSPEINCIHPTNTAFFITYDYEKMHNCGEFSISTKDYDSTTTEKQRFEMDGKEVTIFFTVSRGFSTKLGESPININSSLVFEFAPTNDYEFVYRLWFVAKQFIQYLCYRKNVYFTKVGLDAPAENGKHSSFAEMYMLEDDQYLEMNLLKQGRFIKQKYIVGAEGKILSDIASNKLYLRHLPESFRLGRQIDASRFIMITAAFEWEFKRSYPDGVMKKESEINAESKVEKEIERLINSSTGKIKNKYKFLKSQIRVDALKIRIQQMGKDFDDIIGDFGRHIYSLNGKELKYSEMGERLSSQRNSFAHGNLEKEFNEIALLDLIFMEIVIYAMQLKFHGVENTNIQKAVNDLFGLNHML